MTVQWWNSRLIGWFNSPEQFAVAGSGDNRVHRCLLGPYLKSHLTSSSNPHFGVQLDRGRGIVPRLHNFDFSFCFAYDSVNSARGLSLVARKFSINWNDENSQIICGIFPSTASFATRHPGGRGARRRFLNTNTYQKSHWKSQMVARPRLNMRYH